MCVGKAVTVMVATIGTTSSSSVRVKPLTGLRAPPCCPVRLAMSSIPQDFAPGNAAGRCRVVDTNRSGVAAGTTDADELVDQHAVGVHAYTGVDRSDRITAQRIVGVITIAIDIEEMRADAGTGEGIERIDVSEIGRAHV